MGIALSPERETTASQAPIIRYGEHLDRYELWQERIGAIPPKDFRDNYMVRHGRHCEALVLTEVEYELQWPLSERQRFVKHPTLPGIGGTLDAFCEPLDAVIEAKVLGPFMKAETNGLDLGFLDYYAPQVAAQMACRGCSRGMLAVQQGNTKPALYELTNLDRAFIDDVVQELVKFQHHVVTKTPPGPIPRGPVPPERWRRVDINAPTQENWPHGMKPHLDKWRATKAVAAEHELAKADVKILLPADVGEVVYGAITIKRSRSGAVTIREAT